MEVLGLLSNEAMMAPRLATVIWDGAEQTYASVHPILKNVATGEPQIMPGDGMSRANLEELAMALTGSNRTRSVFPENVLLSEMGIVVWWRKSRHHHIFFDTRTDFDQEANARAALHPPLVFVGKPGSLTVYALAQNERPGNETVLMRAPYYNLEGHGAMCFGTVPIPTAATVGSIPGYERAFFDSSFVHTNLGSRDLTSHPQGHNGLWRELIACSHTLFPFYWLVTLLQGGEPMTLQKAINLR